MKRIITVCSAVVFLSAPAGAALAQGISGTAHDFSAETWNTSGQLCIVCHTPHNADVSVSSAPLWNHAVTAATFTLYGSATLDATVGQPDGVSKLCLSCHDGTVAIDSYGGATGTTFMQPTDPGYVGTDISDDHPVSYVYDAALATADGGLYDPTTQNSGLGGTIDQDMLFSTKVQCASCHNAHDNTNAPFLRKANSGSALCLTCHNK